MQIISKPTTTDILYRWVREPVAFSREVGTDFDPVPCQCDMLRSPLDRITSITSKARQRGASETVCHFVAWCLFAKPADWKCYIVAPNQWVSEENLNRIVGIYEQTPILKDNLVGCTRNDTEFRLAQKQSKAEVLLVGESAGNARRGGTIKRGLLWYEELGDIPKAEEVVQSLNPFADWGLGSTAGILYSGTKRGHSGPFYRKYRYIEQRVAEGNPGYRIFSFPLIQFIRERHGKGISLASLRERKAEVPRHTWLNEYMAQFCDPDAECFAGEDVRRAWQTYQNENIQFIVRTIWSMTD